MIELIGAVSGALAIIGVVLNNHLDRRCFLFWIVSNFLVAYVHADSSLWPLFLKDVVFFLLAIWGLIIWRRKQGRNAG